MPAAHVVVKSSLPEAKKPASDQSVAGRQTESSTTIEVIRKRSDFLSANRGKRFVTPSFVLLAHKRRDDHPVAPDTIRYGITVTKKIGNAVKRNRVKRRFRALLAEALPEHGITGVDHIMIGRKEAAERDFVNLQAELEKGLKNLAKKLT